MPLAVKDNPTYQNGLLSWKRHSVKKAPTDQTNRIDNLKYKISWTLKIQGEESYSTPDSLTK